MTSEELQQMAWQAEDNGSEVYVSRHEAFDELIHYIEIDGTTHYNDDFEDEAVDLYWSKRDEGGLEGAWRE